MEIYRIKAITEADFGCEETGRKEPVALLQLINIKDASEAAEPKYMEAAESTLAEQGIDEGDKVIITESGDIKKYVRVVAAIIVRKEKADGRNTVFATQRGYGEYKDGWEFPGGKVEENETSEQALVREIKEELDTEIEVGELIDTIEYDYPKFHLSMDCYRCKPVKGNLTLKEHEAARWLDIAACDIRRKNYNKSGISYEPGDVIYLAKIDKVCTWEEYSTSSAYGKRRDSYYSFLMPEHVYGHKKNSAKDGGLYYAGQWQELIINESKGLREWVTQVVS